MSDESEIRELEQKRIGAIIARNAEVLDRIFDDSMTFVHLDGRLENKREAIENILTKTQFLSIERPDLKVRVFGDAAVMTGLQYFRVRRVSGQEADLKAMATQVARRTTEGWKLVAWQVTLDKTEKK